MQFLLGQDDGDEEHMSHDIFCEMEELRAVGEEGDVEWKETARFVAQLISTRVFSVSIPQFCSLLVGATKATLRDKRSALVPIKVLFAKQTSCSTVFEARALAEMRLRCRVIVQ